MGDECEHGRIGQCNTCHVRRAAVVAAIEARREGIREGERRERARVVAWLRERATANVRHRFHEYARDIREIADDIEAGDPAKTEGGGET